MATEIIPGRDAAAPDRTAGVPCPLINSESEGVEARLVVEHAFAIAEKLDIQKVILHAEPRDIAIVDAMRGSRSVLWLTANSSSFPIAEDEHNTVVRMPAIPLSRVSRIRLGFFLAVINDYVDQEETVLYLSGGAGSARLDSMLITNLERDFPWFRGLDASTSHASLRTHEFARVVEIALRLASEGREGKPVGTIFVLGSTDDLAPYLTQLVLNPCAGHPRSVRSIHQPGIIETIREFAAMDGAFVVDREGVIESAGTYLDAPAQQVVLPSGLGARHAAAAAVTAATDAVAIVVSESSGAVSVFQGGKTVLGFDKP